MMDKQEIVIPAGFDEIVEKSLQEGKHQRYNRKKAKKRIGIFVVCCMLIVFINGSTVVKAVQGVPVLSEILEFILWSHQEEETDFFDLYVDIPQIKNLSTESLLNQEIKDKINLKTNELKESAYDEYQAYIKTGGSKADYHPMEIKIEYRVTCQNENYLSFFLFVSGTRASSFQEITTYTIDTRSAKQLSLRQLIGKNYQQLIADEIQKQIQAKDSETQSQYFLFDDMKELINEKRSFYINSHEKLVIVFEKYEIATGASGIQEFIMPFALGGEVYE